MRFTSRSSLASRFPFLSILSVSGVVALAALSGCSSTSGGLGGDSEGLGGDAVGIGGKTVTQSLACKSPAPAVFGNALCLCGDFHDIGNFVVAKGADGSFGSVGVNGKSTLVNNTNVDGSWASGGEVAAIGNIKIKTSLYTPAALKVTGNIEIGKDANVGGDLSGIGRVAVNGELRTGGQALVLGYQKADKRGTYVEPSGLPCACEGASVLDVVREVDKAKASNDNGAKAIPTSMKEIGFTDVTFTTGRYYFSEVANIGYSKIKIEGAVSIYLDGSLDEIGADRIILGQGATLDLYVSGTVKTVGYFSAGEKARPGAFRLYVGGADEVSVNVGAQIFHGAIYAPKATLKYVGHTVIEGGLFANTVTGIGNLELRSAHPELADVCGGPSGATGSNSGSTAGTAGAAGGSGGASANTRNENPATGTGFGNDIDTSSGAKRSPEIR
ncbi:MAG: hypothetical protein U0169_10485 [Polyangiaceae bacterium]